MDVCVGERPKPVSRGALEDFNAVFLTMFEYFQGHERIVTVWHENHEEDPLARFGSLTVASVRRWLKYNQLVTVEKEKESLDEPNWRGSLHRNITIIRPTKRGQQAYEDGLVIKVDWGSEYHLESVSVGIGKPYPESATKIYDVATDIWHKAKISMSRQGKWWSERRGYYLENLLDKKTDEALKMIHAWAGAKAWDWNVNHRRRRPRIKDQFYEPPKNQRRLF